MSQKIQRLYWRHNFKRSDSFYLLDGARVIYDELPGVVFEHQMIRKNMPILELSSEKFLGLPTNEIVKFSLDSEDFGLFPFLEVRFFKGLEQVASFSESDKKSIEFVVPEHDDFIVKVRVFGAGYARLLSLTGRVMSTGGFIFEGDRKLSENVGVYRIDEEASDDSLLVTFSKDLRYLIPEFFTHGKPQCHFASLDGTFDSDEVLDFLLFFPQHKMKVYGATAEMLSKMAEYATITTIE